MFIIFFTDFHVFGNLHDIDFASSCMDVLAINAQISINGNSTLNFVKFNRTVFKQYPSSYWPSVGVWVNMDFLTL